MAEENQAAAEGAQQQQNAQFAIQRIYTKDISFETPNSPAIFTKEWKPEIKLDLDTRSSAIEENLYEVVLAVTVTATLGEETAFLCEVQQAGIFMIGDMPEQNKAHTIGSFCPTTLFPYAREAVDNIAVKGGFPPLALAPIDFDGMFRQQQAQAAQQAI